MESLPAFLLVLFVSCAQCSKLTTMFEWSKIDYIYNDRNQDLSSGRLIPEDVILFDADFFRQGNGVSVYVTTPRLIPGTPITLSTVSERRDVGGYLLRPFPEYSWHTPGPCRSTFVNVMRVKIDELERLWAIDAGVIYPFSDTDAQWICPPKIVVFDLRNGNRLLRSYEFPQQQLKNNTRMYNIIVEILGRGSETFVYIADPETFSLHVYDYSRNTSHSIIHPFFYPDPLYGFYNSNGVKYEFMDGILHFSMGYRTREKTLYFHSMSGAREGYVPTRILKDPELAKDLYQYFIYPKERGFHAGPEVIYNNIMIFANIEENSLIAWDTRTSYERQHFRTIEKDTKRLQFPTGMKIFEENVVVTTNRLQNFMVGRIARGEVNYRILVGNIHRLLGA